MYPKLPLSAGPRVLKQLARKLVSPVQLQQKSCVSLVDIVSSVDSLRSCRNSVQALLKSRYCIPSTRFKGREEGSGMEGGRGKDLRAAGSAVSLAPQQCPLAAAGPPA